MHNYLIVEAHVVLLAIAIKLRMRRLTEKLIKRILALGEEKEKVKMTPTEVIEKFSLQFAHRNFTWREALRALAHKEIAFDVELFTRSQIQLGADQAQRIYENILDNYDQIPVEIEDPTEIRNATFTDKIKTEQIYRFLILDHLIEKLLQLRSQGEGVNNLRVIIDGHDITSIIVTEIDQGFVVSIN